MFKKEIEIEGYKGKYCHECVFQCHSEDWEDYAYCEVYRKDMALEQDEKEEFTGEVMRLPECIQDEKEAKKPKHVTLTDRETGNIISFIKAPERTELVANKQNYAEPLQIDKIILKEPADINETLNKKDNIIVVFPYSEEFDGAINQEIIMGPDNKPLLIYAKNF